MGERVLLAVIGVVLVIDLADNKLRFTVFATFAKFCGSLLKLTFIESST